MASIMLSSRELVVRVHGWNVVLALRRTLQIPLSHVTRVRVRPPEAEFDEAIVESWRGVGTYMPHRIASGLVYLQDGPAFFEVRDPQKTIGIDLRNERFCRVVVQLDDETPEHAAERLERAVDRHFRRNGKLPQVAMA